MSSFWAVLVSLVVSINPAAAAMSAVGLPGRRTRAAALAGITSLAIVWLAAGIADPLIDWLDVAPESFRTAAGIVMAVTAARVLWDPRPDVVGDGSFRSGAVPLGWPVVANAAAVTAAMSFSADHGFGRVGAASAIAVALASAGLAVGPGHGTVARGIARMTAAFLVVMAAALIVSGVRDV